MPPGRCQAHLRNCHGSVALRTFQPQQHLMFLLCQPSLLLPQPALHLHFPPQKLFSPGLECQLLIDQLINILSDTIQLSSFFSMFIRHSYVLLAVSVLFVHARYARCSPALMLLKKCGLLGGVVYQLLPHPFKPFDPATAHLDFVVAVAQVVAGWGVVVRVRVPHGSQPGQLVVQYRAEMHKLFQNLRESLFLCSFPGVLRLVLGAAGRPRISIEDCQSKDYRSTVQQGLMQFSLFEIKDCSQIYLNFSLSFLTSLR